jgi:hypothetical protein
MKNVKHISDNFGLICYLKYFRKNSKKIIEIVGLTLDDNMSKSVQEQITLVEMKKIENEFVDLNILPLDFCKRLKGYISPKMFLKNVVVNTFLFLKFDKKHKLSTELDISNLLLTFRQLVWREAIKACSKWGPFSKMPKPEDGKEYLNLFKTEDGFKLSIFLFLDLLLQKGFTKEDLGCYSKIHAEALKWVEKDFSDEEIDEIIKFRQSEIKKNAGRLF